MMKQIIFSGGLGNQMFQYAFYKSLKNKGIDCSINIDLYKTIKMHNGFELYRIFTIPENPTFNNLFKRNIVRLFCKFEIKPFVYKEEPYVFNNGIFNEKALIYKGCWINEDYFLDISHELRELFKFKNIDNVNRQISQKMCSENSVSIHIRRGDYLKIPAYNVCDENYYLRAINYIKEKVELPIFYVFTDDPSWCSEFMRRNNLKFKLIDINRDDESYKDMFLMSSCRHNINANSTFSWWGAWLNENPGKIVIMPSLWTKNTKENPASKCWIKL